MTGEGLRLVAAGLALGFAGGVAVTRLMAFMLYGVSPLDFSAWAVAGVVLAGAATIAAVIPALRASRIDPMIAIQSE